MIGLMNTHKLDSIEFNGIKISKAKHIETVYVQPTKKQTEARNKPSPEPTDQGQGSDIWNDPDMFYSIRN